MKNPPLIYFAASIRGGRADTGIYQRMIQYLQSKGEVLTEHIGDDQLTTVGEVKLSDKEIYRRDMEWLTASSVVVAEVTTPSLGVGYEIGMASQMKKHILCLFRQEEGRRLSAMIGGCPDVTVKTYSIEAEAYSAIDHFFNELK